MTRPDPRRSIGGVDWKNDIFGRCVPGPRELSVAQVEPHCSLIQAGACLWGAFGLHAIMIKNQNKNNELVGFGREFLRKDKPNSEPAIGR
jgi:hypothetical protein